MSDSLSRLVGISNTFNLAVAQKYGQDAASVQKLRAAFTPDDLDQIATLQQSVQDKVMTVFRNGGTEQEAEDAIAPALIEMTEIFANAVLSFADEDELAALMPAEAKNERTAQAFAAQGAHRLSGLCLR
jgi:hypothetical protein